jgi:septal ring factor EnvC (AmiA/AmiB activator)
MNALKRTLLGTACLMGFTAVALRAADVPPTAEAHLNMAASYEEKAKVQEDLMAEHQQMKKDFEKKRYLNEKITPRKTAVEPMEKHCDAIIKDAAALRADLADFAKWHRMRAAELQGK